MVGKSFNLIFLTFFLVYACAFVDESTLAEDYLDFYEQGEFALKVGKWERAVEFFTKSIQDNPQKTLLHLILNIRDEHITGFVVVH